MSIAAPLLAIVADPAWLAMDATARGYHIQLLLVAAQRAPAGTLPGHEPTLRRYLGMSSAKLKPLSQASQPKALVQFSQSEQAPLAALLGAWWLAVDELPPPEQAEHQILAWSEHLWQVRWRPMVMAAWQPIDDDLIKQLPHLAKAKGGYYSPVAASLASLGLQDAQTPAPRSTGRKKAARAAKPAVERTVSVAALAENPLLMSQGQDLERWHDAKEVFSRWAPPLDDKAQRNLWDVGVAAIAGADATTADKARAKALLGKLIKEHGQARVAEAVGALSIRAVPVADAGSFLAALLRNKEEGSPMEQKARSQRARVAL